MSYDPFAIFFINLVIASVGWSISIRLRDMTGEISRFTSSQQVKEKEKKKATKSMQITHGWLTLRTGQLSTLSAMWVEHRKTCSISGEIDIEFVNDVPTVAMDITCQCGKTLYVSTLDKEL